MIINKKLFKIVTIISTVALLVFGIILIYHEVKYTKYPLVEARIIDFYSIRGEHNHTNMKYRHYVKYEYWINNKSYTATKQVFHKAIKDIGKIEKIRYNMDNPFEIENTYLNNGIKTITVLLLIFNMMEYYLIFKNRKS